MADDATFWGLETALLQPADEAGVWDINMHAVTAFLSIDSQFRVTSAATGGVLVTGLDYSGAQAGLALAGHTVTPALWGDIQMIEAGVVAELSAKRGGLQ